MIVIADLHLGNTKDSPLTGETPVQTLDVITRLNFITDRAEETGQTVVIAGDVFHRVNPTTEVISVFFDWLSRCRDRKVQVVMLAGNHDSGVDWVNLRMIHSADFPNVFVATEPVVHTIEDRKSDGNVLLWPHVPFSRQDELYRLTGMTISESVAEAPKTRIIVSHGMVRGLEYLNDVFFEAGNAMDINIDLFPACECLILGHVHDHKSMSKGRVIYPGSVTINNFGEVDEAKGYVEVDLETATATWQSFDSVGVSHWRHIYIDLTEKDESCISEAVVSQEVAPGSIIKLTIEAKAHGIVDEARIRSLFGKYGFVSRFETVVTSVDRIVKPTKQLSHVDLLKGYLSGVDSDAKTKALAISVGQKIITEVLA